MDERATGIILRVRPLTESSLIVQWLTREAGRISTVAKGARRPKSTFQGKLDLYFCAEFTYQPARRSDLHTLREVKIENTHTKLRHDLLYLARAAYTASLIEQTTETGTPISETYELFAEFLDALPSLRHDPFAVFIFEMKLLRQTGLSPNLAETTLSEGSRMLLRRTLELPWTEISRWRASESQLSEMQQFLHRFLIFHLGKIPHGRNQALLMEH